MFDSTMRSARRQPALKAGLLLTALLLFACPPTQAAELTVLHNFSGDDVRQPETPLAIGTDGALYGTARFGGAFDRGMIYQLRPPLPGDQNWRYRTIHSFARDTDRSPAAGLIIDEGGILYGTTFRGGEHGAVFSLTPPESEESTWTLSRLHRFSGADGSQPAAPLTLASNDTLYGTTSRGGAFNKGTVFSLTKPTGNRKRRKYRLLHSFSGSDGANPQAGVVLSKQDHAVLYGATDQGGNLSGECGGTGCGVIFALQRAPGDAGPWQHNVIHAFSLKDGRVPRDLTVGKKRELFGTTFSGGKQSCGNQGRGTVFRLRQPGFGGDVWRLRRLFQFSCDGAEGNGPRGGMVMDQNGALYGTAGGGTAAYGVVFRMLPPPSGGTPWTYEVLHNFSGPDGMFPEERLSMDKDGALYGVTRSGGSVFHEKRCPSGCGTVFKLVP